MLKPKILLAVILILPVSSYAIAAITQQCKTKIEGVSNLEIIKKMMAKKSGDIFTCKQAQKVAGMYHDSFVKNKGTAQDSYVVAKTTYNCKNIPTQNPNPRNVLCEGNDTQILFAHPTGL